jgi:uncharacterized integral membrane protein
MPCGPMEGAVTMTDDRDQAPRYEEAHAPWKLIALLVLVVLLAFFFFQNDDDAPVEFLWFDGDWPLWAVIGVAVLIGVALDRLVGWQVRRARRRRAN